MKLFWTLVLLINTIFFLEVKGHDTLPINPKTTNSLKAEIGLRSYWMSTYFKNDFKEDYALGQTAYLKLTSPNYKGLTLSGRYSGFANVFASEITSKDPITGGQNRYELSLFDVLNPNKKYFGKIEELYLNYKNKSWDITAGKMSINTAFVNAQDGRLSPNFVEGLNLNYSPNTKTDLNIYFLNKISPRSTSAWFNIEESIGLYPVGQNAHGTPSKYKGNVSSNYIGIIEWQYLTKNNFELQLNQTYVENISQTLFIQGIKEWNKPKGQSKWITGIQLIMQHGIGDGGNADLEKKYKNPDDVNFILSSRIGIKNKKQIFHLNYTRIGGNGRFLSPREWGKEPFFTFIPRERTEGLNNVNSLVAHYQQNLAQKGLQIYTTAGVHFLPNPSQFNLNKYGLPSYAQVNVGTKYTPKNWGDSFHFHILYMTKINLLKGDLKPQWEYNKVNLSHLNVIANYTIKWN